MKLHVPGVFARTFADLLLFGVTIVEIVVLFFLTSTFRIVDWIYVVQHLMVLGIALTRRAPGVQDRSLATSVAVGVTYAYPYAQVVYLWWMPDIPGWPTAGVVVVTLAAVLGLISLLALGRWFGVRPALRGLA